MPVYLNVLLSVLGILFSLGLAIFLSIITILWLEDGGLNNLIDGIFYGIGEFINFCKRGFSNERSILYKVYRTENLCGDVTYTIGKERYFGKNKKPEKVEYLYDRTVSHPNGTKKVLQIAIDETQGSNFYSGNFFTASSKIEDKKVVLTDYEEALQVAMDWKYREERKMEEFREQNELEQKKSTTHTTSYTV